MSNIVALLITACLLGEPIYTVNLGVTGDNLIHSTVFKAEENGTYDYMYENIKDTIKSFDVAVLNQETPIVPSDLGYSGYPLFGTPSAIGDAVINTGFDVVTCATNHTIDKGIEGLKYSYDYWKSKDIPALGIRGRYEPAPTYITKNNITLGMLNYTYGLNGLTLPDGSDYVVDMLDDKEFIKDNIWEAKQYSDLVVVFVHWGTEYVYKPTSYQKEWAQFLADEGADLIVGTHPHVIEPLEFVTASDGRKVPVYYSLGNFLSGQDEVPRMLGAIADIQIIKVGDTTQILSVDAIPVVTHISSYSERFQVYLLKDYTEELAEQHRLRRVRGSDMSLSTLKNLWSKVYEEVD